MTFKRLLLTYGILALIAGLFLAVEVFYQNSQLDIVPGVVTKISEETYNYKKSKDSTVEERVMQIPMAEYDYSGKKGEVPVVASWTKGLTSKQEKNLKVGDKVELYFDPYTYSVAAPQSYTIALIQCAIAAAMIYIGHKGVKGYKAEFFGRYKAAFILTCVSSGIVLGYAIYEEFFFVGGGMMPGLEELGRFIFLLILMAAALIAEIVAWIVSVVRYRKKEKAINE